MSTTAEPAASTSPPRPVIPRGTAALLGILSVGAALGVGHLVAAFTGPSSSPFLAVGDTVIRLSPQWLTEFAKTTFGTADKPVLLGGMAVVILLVAVLAGLASRRVPGPGRTAIVVLGLAGVAAVVFGPGFTPLDLVAPAAALVAGLGAFGWLHATALRAAATGDGAGGVSRRSLLIGSGAVGVGALAAGAAGWRLGPSIESSRAAVTARLASADLAETAPAIPAGADFPNLPTPSFVTPNDEFYRVDVALRIPTSPAEDWTMRVHGLVDRELNLTFDDLMSRPLVERTITMTCVSNPVGGEYLSTANFVGVELRDILMEAGVRPGADQILTTSADDWTCGTPLDVVMEPGRGALLAVGMNGEALPPIHGFPVRMLVPGLYGFVSATKWLADMEITTFAADQAYWLQRGWGRRAPIKTQSRIDTPRAFQTVPSGRVPIAGIAWSQPIGIERVEISVDNGPWQETELAAEVNYDTWRLWRTEVDVAPGSHSVRVRATDRNGTVQTEERAEPIPDGATGWQSVFFTAS